MQRIYLVGSLAVVAVAVAVFAWMSLADDDGTPAMGRYCPLPSASLADCLTRQATAERYIIVTTTPEPN
jgi:hypothetical protein